MKRLSSISNVIVAILFNSIIAALIASVLGFNPLPFIIAFNVVSLRYGKNSRNQSVVLRDGLNKEIWLEDIKEGFYPDSSFLSEAVNWDMWVENDKINLAEAGADPDVLLNNTTYPVPTYDRTDTALEVSLDTWDTTNTRLRNAELVELSYDKMASVVKGHKNSLLNKFAQRAIHAYAPTSNTTFTPVLNKTAETAFSFDHIIDLQQAFDDIDAPDDRILVLSPKHQAALSKEDKILYKAIMAKPGETLYGFKIYKYSKNPLYVASTGAKKAFGASINPATDKVASVGFCASEVMKAMGTMDMFYTLKSPSERADILGFQMRGIALPIRNKMIGSIIQ